MSLSVSIPEYEYQQLRTLQLAFESMGVYPKATISNGVETPRTPEQDGYNRYGSELVDKMVKIDAWMKTLDHQVKMAILKLTAEPEDVFSNVSLGVNSEGISLWATCSDTFMYACADAEEIPLDKVLLIQDLVYRFGYDGITAWICFTRKQMPTTFEPSPLFKAAYDFVQHIES